MPKHEVPGFMMGTTAWSFYGYFFKEAPPIDLLAPEALASTNPWVVFAAVLEHAKRGSHAYLPRLQAGFATGPDQGPDRASLHLTGDAGRDSDLAVLKSVLEGAPDAQRAYAAEAAALAGRLALVPSMVQAWKSVSSRGHHETIGFAVSSLLESRGGPIAAVAGVYPHDVAALERLTRRAGGAQAAGFQLDEEGEETEFEVRVRARLAELQSQLPDGASIWEGRVLDLAALAEEMYGLVRRPATTSYEGQFTVARHKLESATGINCSLCFERGMVSPLAAAAVLEEVLESDVLARYEPGARYFFGHRIPS